MTTVRWEDVRRRADERRRSEGLPSRSVEEKQAAMERLLAEVRAYRTAELRREQDPPSAVAPFRRRAVHGGLSP